MHGALKGNQPTDGARMVLGGSKPARTQDMPSIRSNPAFHSEVPPGACAHQGSSSSTVNNILTTQTGTKQLHCHNIL